MKTAILASIIAGAAAFVPASQTTSSTALNAVKKAPVAKKAPLKKAPVKKAPVKKAPVKKSAVKAVAGKPFAGEIGVQEPLGYWDPLGLVADGDQEKFDRLRYVEIKHGRISMLAVVGYLTAESGIRLPGQISLDGTKFSDIPNGFAALKTMPAIGLAQILLFVGWLELFGWKQAEGSFPGDFGGSSFPVGWVADYSDAEKERKRAVELNQGRAAMMGILALMVHEQLGVSILP